MEARRRGTRERKSSLKGTEALEQEPDSEEEVAGKQRAEEEARKATVLRRRRQGKQMQEATISPPTSGTSARPLVSAASSWKFRCIFLLLSPLYLFFFFFKCQMLYRGCTHRAANKHRIRGHE